MQKLSIKFAVVAGMLAFVAILATSAAEAGFTPAWTYLSPALRAHLAAEEGGPLYLPAKTPLFYRYRSGAAVADEVLTVPFTNRVRVRQGFWRWTQQDFLWRVRPLRDDSCANWNAVDQTFHVTGNQVYWSNSVDGGTAWRCLTDKSGVTHVLSASSGENMTAVGLALVVASGLDVSSRTNAPRTALTVAPTSVRPGQTVLVQGVAGGCTAGDTVTILSHAFAAVHSFAGVPAALAEVGAAGRFSAHAAIPTSRQPGTYLITARCGGGNLGVSAKLRVER